MARSHQRPFSRRQLAVIAKIAFIEAMALSLIIPTISSTGEITTTLQLGQWTGFPNLLAGTITPSCSVGGIAVSPFGDNCVLFNSITNYQAVYPFTTAGSSSLSVHFQVNCIKPALKTSGGSVLYLQYANYTFSDVPAVWENVSNYKITGSTIYIDNTLGWPCPGVLVNTIPGIIPVLPAGSVNGYIFRVVGVCGCNATTVNAGNPIINNVEVSISAATNAPYSIQATGYTTAHFLWLPIAPHPVTSATTVTISWIATNETSTGCGFSTDVCVQSGTASCTIAIGTDRCTTQTVNFVVTFTGTVNVVTQIKLNPQIALQIITTVTLFSVQTIAA